MCVSHVSSTHVLMCSHFIVAQVCGCEPEVQPVCGRTGFFFAFEVYYMNYLG